MRKNISKEYSEKDRNHRVRWFAHTRHRNENNVDIKEEIFA